MKVTVDGRRILEEATELAFPRYPGTPGDRRAIEWLAGRLAESGLPVTRETFSYDIRPAFAALRGLLIGVGLLLAGAGLLAGAAPLAAGAVLLVALSTAGIFLVWAPGLERIYRGAGPTETENVFARRAPRGAPRLTLVYVAHHDSKSQNLTLPWRAALTCGGIAAALGLAGLLVWAALTGAPPGGGRLAPAVGLGGALCLLVLSTLSSGNASPGGVDNAGSVGILLELARRLPARLPADVEAIFLSPGAEEDHMVGAMRWLDRHGAELSGRPVWTINIDGAGIPGKLALLERYGLGRSFSRRLSAEARAAAGELELPVRGVLIPPALGVDAIPFAHRGLDSITLASGSFGRAVLAVHSAGDVAANLSQEALERAAGLALRMGERLSAAV